MSTATVRSIEAPIGAIKQFGPYGPEYQILSEAPDRRGERMVHIVIVRTGEELDYPLLASIEDMKAL